MKYFLTIDQIQEEKAVLVSEEPEIAVNFPLDLLPKTITEGDILQVSIEVDSAERLRRELEIEQLLRELTADDKK